MNYLLIADNEPEGMTNKEIRRATGLQRDRVRTICKEYIEKGVLTKHGKFEKYHLGEKATEDPSLSAFLFEHNMASSQFFRLSDRDLALAVSTQFCDAKYCEEIFKQRLRQKRQRQKRQNVDDFDKLYLFGYALRLGAIVSYQLIQAMRYAQQQPSHVNQSKKIEFIRRYLDNTITPMFLIHSFHNLLSILESRSWKNPKSKPLVYWPDLMEKRFSEMEHIFKNTFPYLFEELERIRTSIPDQITAYKHRISESNA
jgi:hypothetical protein